MDSYNSPHHSRLAEEIELNRDYESDDEALLLSLVRTHQLLEQASALFFSRFDLTVTQFNALMIVRDWEGEGIKATELARRIVINRASAGSLVDGLCKRGLLERRAVPNARRAYHLRLTRAGRSTLDRVLPDYYAMVNAGFQGFGERRKETVLRFLGELRGVLDDKIAALTAVEPVERKGSR